ncbi:serine/threonine-protein kinase [Nocardioides psychrotolerans]|uniref:non-specific serine/threonine protein kinase n=1 Tax=Nocardioides psychrotolerans TaxID=1005945 RepID=A0A1I3IHE0_9ACTN|nr:serine/threonine-protein kinase [Nocardioides psychrotolerans]SFI47455.1 Serine/threonine protein kinase [Nocardioides psychrotolerans]
MTTRDDDLHVDPDRTRAVPDVAALLNDTAGALPASSPDQGWLGERYVLDAVVGRGGVGDVHRATDTLLHRSVAVKVLRQRTASECDRVRFGSEARTLAGLMHPGLVTVLDVGDTEGRPYLVMELVEGSTLSGALADGPLPVAEVARILSRVAEALAYAHGRGVVHRDVKPGNVLLGDDGRVKLADFGIARLVGDNVRHTLPGTLIGTVAYLAPEQVTGDELTQAVDVYALGLVLLESVTGAKAYAGPVVEAALARLTRPPHVPDELPARVRDLVRAMTATDPRRRPTAGHVADELAHVAREESGAALPLPTTSLAGRRWTSRPVLVAAAALVVLALAAGSGLVGGPSDGASGGPSAGPSAGPSVGPSVGGAPSAAARPAAARGVAAATEQPSPRKGSHTTAKPRAEAPAKARRQAKGHGNSKAKGHGKGGKSGASKGKGRR